MPRTGVYCIAGESLNLVFVVRGCPLLSGFDFLLLIIIFKDFIYLRERENETDTERTQTGGAAEGEGEAGSLLSREPDTGLDPRTLGS